MLWKLGSRGAGFEVFRVGKTTSERLYWVATEEDAERFYKNGNGGEKPANPRKGKRWTVNTKN